MPVKIREAKAADASGIAGLLRSLGLFKHITAETPGKTRTRVARHLGLCAADDSHSVLVALEDGVIAGYCAAHWLPYLMLKGPEGYVSELFVSEACRGKGVGGLLLKAVEAEARARGCCRLMLLNLRTRESYQRGFYKKQGWEERKEAANFLYPLPGKPATKHADSGRLADK